MNQAWLDPDRVGWSTNPTLGAASLLPAAWCGRSNSFFLGLIEVVSPHFSCVIHHYRCLSYRLFFWTMTTRTITVSNHVNYISWIFTEAAMLGNKLKCTNIYYVLPLSVIRNLIFSGTDFKKVGGKILVKYKSHLYTLVLNEM